MQEWLFNGMVTAVAIGLIITAACVVIHGLGTGFLVHFLRTKGYDLLHGRSPLYAMLAMILAVWVLMAMHILEIILWAVVYLQLVGITELQNMETALYFSAVTYTTLGYGDIVLHDHWRIMSAIEAMCGIMLFGWSTAMLFAVVREIIRQVDPVTIEYDRRVQERLEEIEGDRRRNKIRAVERDVTTTTTVVERAEPPPKDKT